MRYLAAGIIAATALACNVVSDVWGPESTKDGWNWTSSICVGVAAIFILSAKEDA